MNSNIVGVNEDITPIFGFMTFAKNFKNAKFYRTSVLIWALFIAYEVLVVYFVSGKVAPIFDYINAYIVNIILFYVHAHLLLPYVNKRPIYIAIGLIVLEFVAYCILKSIGTYVILHLGLTASDPFKFPQVLMSQLLWRFVFIMSLSSGYWFALHSILQTREIADLEKNKLLDQLQNEKLQKQLATSEIAYLKSQINPHFLFNTLNFLYNSSLRSSPELSRPILLLSDIMRYALTDVKQTGKVDLSEELEQINTFIALNQFRFDHNLQLIFDVKGDAEDFKILPLILLTPVENIFKYADLRNADYPAKINVEITENRLYFSSNNKKLKARRAVSSHGVGLQNLKLRLEAYYGSDGHDLHIEDTIDNYIFKLEINL